MLVRYALQAAQAEARLPRRDGLGDSLRDRDVILDVNLCSCCNASAGPATISFLGVRNFEMVQDALESARRKNSSRKYIDEIIGIIRSEDRGILLDLQTAGGVRVDAQGIFEA